MTKKKGLGRGLSALLEDPGADIMARATLAENAPVAGRVSDLPIKQIEANPFQPRTTFSKEALVELAKSIRELGIIQPVTVRKMGNDRFQLISGERRFRAAQAAGLDRIPAYVRIANDQSMLEMALVENIQREDLDAIEVAISFQRLHEECNMKQEDLGDKVGKDRSTVTNYLRLLKLPPEIQMGIRQRQIGMGHARALINIPDPARQLELFQRIIESQLSVREVEQLARANSKRGSSNPRMSTAQHKALSKALSTQFGTRVSVKSASTGKGRIEIHFKDQEELDRLNDLLGR